MLFRGNLSGSGQVGTPFAALVATFAILAPFGVLNAQEVLQSHRLEFLPDADSTAGQWVRANPDGIAVAIRLGTDTTVPIGTIEYWLRKDFANNGVRKVRFFYERGNAGSSVVYRTRVHVWGPFALADSRAEVAEASAQFLFELKRGLN